MDGHPEDITAADVTLAYEAIVSLGDKGALGDRAAQMRTDFQRRTGSYGPEDPWFEARSRAFWDDALTTQRFASFTTTTAITPALPGAHRGFFIVSEVDDEGAHLIDVWSGAELLVTHLDDTQALTLQHAEGPMDARVIAAGSKLYVLPGAYHHPPDGLDPALDVLDAARARGMSTQEALDALMKMELVFRSSSRVKAGFAYRVETLK